MKKILFLYLILNTVSFSQWNFHYVMAQRLTTIFTFDTSYVWIGGDNGAVHKSTNGGTNWIDYSTGTGNTVNGLYFSSITNGISICGNQVLKTTDGGETWSETFSILGQFTSLFFINNQIGFATGYNPTFGSFVYLTSNGGNNWTSNILIDTLKFNSIFFVNENTGFICGGSPAVVYKTTDGGNNWNKLILNNGNNELNKISFADENKGYTVGTNGLFYKTTNGGESWEKLNFYTFRFLGVEAKDNHVWATVSDITADYIIHSVDNGNTWYKQYTAFEILNDIKILNNTGWAVGNFGLILKTTNRGVIPLPTPQTPTLLIPNENAINVPPRVTFGWVNANLVMFRLQVSDVNNFNNPPYDILVIERFCELELELNKRYYWRVRAENPAGLSNWSVVRTFSTDDPTSVEEEIFIKKDFVLFQNYPNPFNPVTVISYQLTVDSYVTLKVFDVLGKETVVLVNEQKKAGIYNINFDAAGLKSGVYYYRLIINNNKRENIFTETKKMLLLK